MQQPFNPVDEGARLMVICNACRYCEGYCAVFPAMERRLTFNDADMHYLANLCHNCAECYYACQYAPPHEFAVNVPKVLAEIRAQSYRKYAWPRFVTFSVLGAVIVGIAIIALLAGGSTASGANFYGIISHDEMILTFGVVFTFIIVVHAAGFFRFLRESGESPVTLFQPSVLWNASRDALSLKNLGSGGAGCTYPNERHSQTRRVFHHFTFYGFMLCVASTTVAAVYHSFFGWEAPHAYFSVPVVLGTLGGIGLLVGPVGLFAVKQQRDSAIVDSKQDRTDIAFLVLLYFSSLTGLLLMALRETNAMGILLRVHLGVVFALFLTLPYGKFVHGLYRWAALLRSTAESLRHRATGQN